MSAKNGKEGLLSATTNKPETSSVKSVGPSQKSVAARPGVAAPARRQLALLTRRGLQQEPRVADSNTQHTARLEGRAVARGLARVERAGAETADQLRMEEATP